MYVRQELRYKWGDRLFIWYPPPLRQTKKYKEAIKAIETSPLFGKHS